MALVSLSEGARLTGRSKGTISKALSSGKISYTEKTANGYLIDTSELFREFPPKPTQPVGGVRLETAPETHENKAMAVEVQLLREQLTDLRADRDAWREQAQRLLLEGPVSSPGSDGLEPAPGWRFWRRRGS
jgi:hypothetical protein